MLSLKINRPNQIAVRDRRSGSDRRTSRRFAVNIEIQWESLLGEQPGTISDLSTSGCFVLCGGVVEDGEHVRLQVPLVDGQFVELWGEVVNYVYEIGFALRFLEPGATERLFLERLTHKLSLRSESNRPARRR